MDWPLGPALKQHRINEGLSVRAAAALTKKVVSETRWRQLESGFQSIPGGKAPINTTVRTVVAAAKAVRWNPREAAELAGFDPNEAGPPHVRAEFSSTGSLSGDAVDLTSVPADALLGEVRRRMEVVSGRPVVDESEISPPINPAWLDDTAVEPPAVRDDENGQQPRELGGG